MNIYSGGGGRDGCAFASGLCALDLEDAGPTPKGSIHTHAEPGGSHGRTRFTRPRRGGGQRQLRLATGVGLPAASLTRYLWGGWGQAGRPLIAADASCAAAELTLVAAALQDGQQRLYITHRHSFSLLLVFSLKRQFMADIFHTQLFPGHSGWPKKKQNEKGKGPVQKQIMHRHSNKKKKVKEKRQSKNEEKEKGKCKAYK